MANFQGGAGADVLPDSIVLGAVQAIGNDTFDGQGGDDTLIGYSGNDVFAGGAGADLMIGGILNTTGIVVLSGVDEVDYSASSGRVVVQMYQTADLDIDILGISVGLTGVATGSGGDAEGDRLIGIINLTGSAFNDYLGGNSDENTLTGGAGNDGLNGSEGGDILDGGAGVDMADYYTSSAAVTINLATNTATGGDAAGDTLISIENLRGSDFNDSLTGNAGNNRMSGIDGTDTLDGGAGNDKLVGGTGADVLIGGAGEDTALYDNAAAGVTASLADPSVNTGDAAGDTYSGIEHLHGSSLDDTLIGSARANYLIGWGGDDRLIGGDGADRLVGGDGADTFVIATIGDSNYQVPDQIMDFSHAQGDKIDLSALTGGSGTFIGGETYHGVAGEVRFVVRDGILTVGLDVDGNGHSDVRVQVVGATDITASDFVL